MSETDFDLESLAVYLHLTRQQVLKLAERGQLPGRKVAGKWRFARAPAVTIISRCGSNHTRKYIYLRSH